METELIEDTDRASEQESDQDSEQDTVPVQLFYVTESGQTIKEDTLIFEEFVENDRHLTAFMRADGARFCSDTGIDRVAMIMYQGIIMRKALVYHRAALP